MGETKKTASPGQGAREFPIEELRIRQGVSGPVFAGVCAAMDWRPGKAVAEETFQAAVKAFTEAPIRGTGTPKRGTGR